MIARMWHGIAKKEDQQEYIELMKSIAIPDYKKTEGFVKLEFLTRVENDITHFNLITYWENLEAIKNFAGEDYELAKYYEEDKKYLIEFEKKVLHYEVFATLQ